MLMNSSTHSTVSTHSFLHWKFSPFFQYIFSNNISIFESIKTHLSQENLKAKALMGPVASRQLGQMLIAVLFFHISEFVLALFIHGASRVNRASFLISKPYVFAMICGLIEYAIEIRFVPELKRYWWASNIGLIMVVTGEIIRKTGILTACRSFTHDIRRYLEDDHELVTYGIYRYIRHPGYSGFFIWSIGTQVMLCNPLCTITYALVTWRFFWKRIAYEEFFLRQFFGHRFVEYAQRVPSGIPFIK